MLRSVLQLVRRPLYWIAMLGLPLFLILMLTSLMSEGLPAKAPAAIVDKNGTALSANVTQNLSGMQMADIKYSADSYTQARHMMQEGKVYGYFLIPENFEADLLSGRQPVITFYTNMAFYVPASLLFKTFKTTAVYTKAGVASTVLEAAGQTEDEIAPLLMPVNITTRGLNNPELNYAIYLCNSFVPCMLQLMIMLVTCFSLGQEIKYGTSIQLLNMADGSIIRAVFAKLLPQTLLWFVMAIFMEAWLFRYQGYPMNGSWLWITLSELMFVLACQGFALFVFCVIPNLRMSLSICSLLGILSFSIAAFSFPVESMYGAIGIFNYIVPTRYNFLIYIDQALNGIDIYYSRWWFVAYIVFMLLPLTYMWNLKRAMRRPVYAP